MNSLERSLQQTDHLNPKIPVIIYTGRDMTSEENDLLQQYARTVVIKGAESQDRLVDEVSLFLHSVTSALPPEQQKIIRMIHDKDEVLRGKKILLVDDDTSPNRLIGTSSFRSCGCGSSNRNMP